MEWVLNEIERDLFREIANIGLSKAADALAVISKEKVLLNAPDIYLVPPKDISSVLPADDKDIIVVHSDIKGDLTGKTLLLFSQNHVKRFIQESVPSLPEHEYDPGKLQDSLLIEITNIITGSIVTQFGNIFRLKVYGSVPEGPDYDTQEVLRNTLSSFPAFQPLIFSIRTKFLNSGRLLELPLLIVFDTDTLLKLLSIIRSGNYITPSIFRKQEA